MNITNITIGQHYPTDSIIHKLDPRVKILGVFIYVTVLFISKNFLAYFLASLFLVATIYTSNVPLKFILRGLKSIFFILFFTIAINTLFTKGEIVLFNIFNFTVTLEGIIFAIKMAIRLVLLILGSSLLTLTTSPIQLTDAIEYILKPLKKIGVPSHEIAMMMTIALRFIPTLLEEMDKIMKSQMARGASFDTGGLFKRAKNFIPLFIPLFISSFRRADELAMAMEARCYRGDFNRTRVKPLKYAKKDYLATYIILGFFLIEISTKFFNTL